jgi:hypothetical protein
MMSPTQQGEIRQVGRATIHPMVEMMGVTPGRGPRTAREDTAPVAHRQGGPLSRVDDPGGPADLQRLARGSTQDRGQQGHGRPQPRLNRARAPGSGSVIGAGARGSTGGIVSGGSEVTGGSIVGAGAAVRAVAGGQLRGAGGQGRG